MYSYDDFKSDLSLYKKKYVSEKYNGEIVEECFINEREFIKEFRKNHDRKKRYKHWLKRCLQRYDYLYFITLTFEDRYINDYETLFKEWLSSVNCYNFESHFNIDYGLENNRVHYHAICNIDVSNKWPYGFHSSYRIGNTDLDIDRLSKYINKLTNHAFKKDFKIIYTKDLTFVKK